MQVECTLLGAGDTSLLAPSRSCPRAPPAQRWSLLGWGWLQGNPASCRGRGRPASLRGSLNLDTGPFMAEESGEICTNRRQTNVGRFPLNFRPRPRLPRLLRPIDSLEPSSWGESPEHSVVSWKCCSLPWLRAGGLGQPVRTLPRGHRKLLQWTGQSPSVRAWTTRCVC